MPKISYIQVLIFTLITAKLPNYFVEKYNWTIILYIFSLQFIVNTFTVCVKIMLLYVQPFDKLVIFHFSLIIMTEYKPSYLGLNKYLRPKTKLKVLDLFEKLRNE
uniref:7TM_GPCR_Srx domain-containing protein n=1 Tax=Heterorhabditis bacteriophora TaxID=37862 RepID=A0A1I7WCI5_HETBA